MKKLALFFGLLSLISCSKREPIIVDDNEGITTVELTFTPTTGLENPIIYNWRDGLGELIQLKKNTEYNLSVSFLNESGLKTEDLTEEVEEESDAHLVVVKSDPVDLFSIKAMDKDSKGRKVGLKNKLKFKNTNSSGTIRVILKHQPPVNGIDVKDGMNESIGSTDADVIFPVSIK